MCHRPSSSKTVGTSNEVAVAMRPVGALPPTPRDLSHSGQNVYEGGSQPPPAIPAAESALGLRPRSALSSAQVFPEWITSTSPCNDLSANGDNPLNSLSHSRGSVQAAPARLPYDGAVLCACRGRVPPRPDVHSRSCSHDRHAGRRGSRPLQTGHRAGAEARPYKPL